MFPQENWGTNPFNSGIKKKMKRTYCNGAKEDQILRVFKRILCHCSKWSSAQHHVLIVCALTEPYSCHTLGKHLHAEWRQDCHAHRQDGSRHSHWQGADPSHMPGHVYFSSSNRQLLRSNCSSASWMCGKPLIHQGGRSVVHCVKCYHWASTDAINCKTFVSFQN